MLRRHHRGSEEMRYLEFSDRQFGTALAAVSVAALLLTHSLWLAPRAPVDSSIHSPTNSRIEPAPDADRTALRCVHHGGTTPCPGYGGTVWDIPDIGDEHFQSDLASLTYRGVASRKMFDRRCECWLQLNAFLFDAAFADGHVIEMQLNPEFGSSAAARPIAETYAAEFGKIPRGLRRQVLTSWIHKGDADFGGGNSNILIHVDGAASVKAAGRLMEVLIHEAAHSTTDPLLNPDIDGSGLWAGAQASDPCFVSSYAMLHPNREDIAEMVLPHFLLRDDPDRFPPAERSTLANSVPDRLALLDDRFDLWNTRRLSAWGSNSWSQSAPPRVPSQRPVAIDAGSHHATSLAVDGTVHAWGRNDGGQASVPSTLGACSAIGAGGANTAAVKMDGSVVVWGDNAFSQRNVPSTVTQVRQVDVGLGHVLALNAAGRVFGWGRNDRGQASVPASLPQIAAISAGHKHSLAMGTNGLLYAWGDNQWGQSSPPAAAQGSQAIAAGAAHSLAVRTDGSVVGWGLNSTGETRIPAGITTATAVSAGDALSVALLRDGRVRCWGRDDACKDRPWTSLGRATVIAAGDAFVVSARVPPGNSRSDLNDDGTVNGADLGEFLGGWTGGRRDWLLDLNQDGNVSGADLGILIGDWGPCRP